MITDPNNDKLIYGYSTGGDLISVSDWDSNPMTFSYTPASRISATKITDGFGRAILNAQFNTSGRLTQFANASGSLVSINYNLNTLSRSSTAPWTTNAKTETYNNIGLLTQSVDADGNVTNYTYNGTFTASETQVLGTTSLTSTYTENADGEFLTETDPSSNTTRFSYDQYGDPTSNTDALGNTSYLGYNPSTGDLTHVDDPYGRSGSFQL